MTFAGVRKKSTPYARSYSPRSAPRVLALAGEPSNATYLLLERRKSLPSELTVRTVGSEGAGIASGHRMRFPAVRAACQTWSPAVGAAGAPEAGGLLGLVGVPANELPAPLPAAPLMTSVGVAGDERMGWPGLPGVPGTKVCAPATELNPKAKHEAPSRMPRNRRRVLGPVA